MNLYKNLLSCLLLFVSFNGVSQGFQEKIIVSNVYFEPNGEYAYIVSDEPTKKLYKWNIENATLASEWALDIEYEHMVFVGNDIYLSSYSNEILKLNKDNNKFEVYYQSKRSKDDFKVLGIGTDGRILNMDIKGLVGSAKQSWGPLLLSNPIDGSETLIEMTVSGTVHWYTPSIQPSFNDHIIYVDYAKKSFDKMKLKAYNKTGKSSILMKKVKYGNYILHGFEDVLVFEYHSKNDNASRFILYDQNASEVRAFDWSIYRGVQYDYVKKELYFIKNDRSEIDVFSAKTYELLRTIPAFEDFFLRSSDDLLGGPYITNGKHHRLVKAPSGDMEELIGYFEAFNFDTGKYERVGRPLRDGYFYEEYDEFGAMASEMREKAIIDAAKANRSKFKSGISYIQFLPPSGNRPTFEEIGKDMNVGIAWNVAQVASYDQLATNIGKVAECDDKLVVLVRATDWDNTMKGDYIIDRDETIFYISVVNSNMKYEKISIVGKDVQVTKTNKHTIKVEQAGSLSTPTSLSWRDEGDTFWVTGNHGSYTVDKGTCSIR